MSQHDYHMNEINNQKHTDQADYMYVWNNFVNYHDSDSENFGQTDLATVLKCLKKANFRPSSMVFASSWGKSILLDKDFISFVREYDQKILKPASNLTGDIKRKEHISLVFASACNIGTQVTMFALDEYKMDDLYTHSDICRVFQGNMIDFLADINRGTSAQQLECLNSIDKLMDEYPEQRVALSELCGFKEPTTFIHMVAKLLKDAPEDEIDHIEDIIHSINKYMDASDLEKELAHKNEPGLTKKLKV